MRTQEIRIVLFVASICLLLSAESFAQRQSSSSGIRLGQRWATPGGGLGQTYSPIPGRTSSSPAWNLRPPSNSPPVYSNSRSSAARYDASSNHRGRGYSHAPAPVQYSRGPQRGHRHAYSVAPQVFLQHQGWGGNYSPFGHNYGTYNGLTAYDELRLLHGISPRYGVNYGPVYPSIVAPPIVVPHALNGLSSGVGSNAVYHQAPGLVFTPDVKALSPSNEESQEPPMALGRQSQQMSRKIPADERPVRDEFGEPSLAPPTTSSAVDRIRSLRYQASADDAFRRKDYESAAALYQAASETAPDRRAPRLRQVWAMCAVQDYVGAAVQLKDVLLMPADATSAWIDAETLYGTKNSAHSALHSDEVWNWLQERPNSTDRLLLAAAVQKLRGSAAVAREIMQAASHAGLEERLRRSLDEISTVDPVRNVATDPNEPDDGLRMKGRYLTPAAQELQSVPGPPEPLSSEENQALVPVPQSGLELRPSTESPELIISD